MEDSILALKSFELLEKDLKLDSRPDLMVDDPFSVLQKFLTSQIRHLLDQNFEFLLNAMYRIDISEAKLEEILNFTAPEKVASELAKAIIVREKQKVLTRIKYSS